MQEIWCLLRSEEETMSKRIVLFSDVHGNITGLEAIMNEVVFEIASLQTTSIMRVSFSFDKVVADYESKKAYNIAKSKYFAEAYKKLISDFNQGVQSIVSKMNHALPAEQKEANKKNLAK